MHAAVIQCGRGKKGVGGASAPEIGGVYDGARRLRAKEHSRRRTKRESESHVGELLLRRIAAGDAAAVRECMDRFGGLVWSLARRFTFNDAEAQDAVQEVFIEVWKNAHRYDESVASETAFVAMLARRRLIDRRRRSDRQLDKAALPEGTIAVQEPQEAPTQRSEEAKRAAAALQTLSPDQQRVLRLSIFQGLSHEKIATATGLPMGTVKTHARRGLLRLRELLGRPNAEEARGGA